MRRNVNKILNLTLMVYGGAAIYYAVFSDCGIRLYNSTLHYNSPITDSSRP